VKVTVNGDPAPVHSSVAAVFGGGEPPPKAKAEVVCPAPPIAFLPVFKSDVSVQLTPFHSSVNAEPAGSGLLHQK
jgi:hypothetical protein